VTGSTSRDDKLLREHEALDLRGKAARVAKFEAEADMLGERVAVERENRRLRFGIAIAALALMAVQVLVANGIFGWYGVTAGWDVPPSAIGAWLGTTVVEVVAVVLVIVNYLFPNERREYA
jgi:hypothetical protein